MTYLASGTFMLILGVCSSLWHFIAAVSVFGGFLGVVNTYFYGLVARYLGSERLSFIFGMMGCIMGSGFLSMPVTLGEFTLSTDVYKKRGEGARLNWRS